jgi:hypothetical protein
MEDLWDSFASMDHDGSQWVLRDSSGNELATADTLEAALSELARAGGGEVTW